MFVNKSDVADDGMLAADDNSDLNLSNNDANVQSQLGLIGDKVVS